MRQHVSHVARCLPPPLLPPLPPPPRVCKEGGDLAEGLACGVLESQPAGLLHVGDELDQHLPARRPMQHAEVRDAPR
jgi:hypothetical protein